MKVIVRYIDETKASDGYESNLEGYEIKENCIKLNFFEKPEWVYIWIPLRNVEKFEVYE